MYEGPGLRRPAIRSPPSPSFHQGFQVHCDPVLITATNHEICRFLYLVQGIPIAMPLPHSRNIPMSA